MCRLSLYSLILLLCCSCATTTRFPKSPVFSHNSKTGETVQTGDAAKHASISSVDSKTEIPFPPGSVITIRTPDAPAATVGTTTAIPVATVTEHREVISTPTAFTPPAPASPSEIAKGDGIRIFYYVGGFLALAACALAYLEHGKAAIIAGIGAIAVPCLANFLSSEWAVRACVAVVCISGALFIAWHFVKGKLPSSVVSSVESVETKISTAIK